MATATRLNSVTYGTLKMGESTSYHIHDAVLGGHEYEALSVEFTVVFRAASESALLTLEAALIAGIRKPNQLLKVVRNSSNFINLTHSGNTGFNSRGQCRELDTHRSNRSRAFRVRISVMLPADLSGMSYRQDSTWDVEVDSSGVRTITVEARYTAGGSDSAYTVATTNFGTYVASLETIVDNSATWDTTDRVRYRLDDQNKVCTAVAVSRELIHAQSGSGTDDASVDGITYLVRVIRDVQPSHVNTGALPFVTVVVDFQSPVRSGQTTDLDSYVTGTVEPYLKTLVETETDAPGAVNLQGFEYRLQPIENTISGTATYSCQSRGLVRSSLQIDEFRNYGRNLSPIVDGGEGFTCDLHPGPQLWVRTITAQTVEVGSNATVASSRPYRDAIASAEREGYLLQEEPQNQVESFELAVQGREGDRLTFTTRQRTARLRKWRPRKGGGTGTGTGGGSGGGTYVPESRAGR